MNTSRIHVRNCSHLIRVEGIKTFEELLAKHGKGYGCEVCKPTVGSLLASCWNEYILKPQHTPLQDTNDNFLANIQKDGTYSVIPHYAGGEVPLKAWWPWAVSRVNLTCTPKLPVLSVSVCSAQKDDLPEIWRQLIEAGFETGHAYAKALRMAKTCVGSTWCRYGVGDSVGFGVELENRYKGIRTPHKMKFGVSGCTRECAEAQGKDVGIIATEKGWNLYVCGNGGMKPRHAENLLAADIDRETLLKYLDRFMMFYIRTADKLTRTAPWLDNLEGGIEYLKSVIIDDKLGLNQHLEEEMARLREAVVCEWTETVNTSSAQVRFKHFINSDKRDPNVQVVPEREQHRPATPYERIPVTLVEENA